MPPSKSGIWAFFERVDGKVATCRVCSKRLNAAIKAGAMFTFNFGGRSDNEKPATGTNTSGSVEVASTKMSTEIPSGIDWEKYSTAIHLDDIDISVVDSNRVVSHLNEIGFNQLSALQADKQHSDLIPGVYEGGMKIWESTYDLGALIRRTMPTLLGGKSILDLGCGSGILGILALKLGSDCVHFQDYNSEVLSYLTIPSVNLNGPELMDRCEFWCGDWSHYENADDTKFDIVLTSETIYNPANHDKLHSVIKSKLKPGGVAYVAGKAYYFGVGGSMKSFREVVEKEQVFTASPVWTSDEGVMREILSLQHRSTK